MFALNPRYETALATPWGVFYPGREADLSKVPAAVKERWLEAETMIQNDQAPDLFEDMPLDGLSKLNRDQLKQFIVDHSIPLKVKMKWSDEEVREAIRQLSSPENLAIWLAPPAPVAPAPAPSTSPQS